MSRKCLPADHHNQGHSGEYKNQSIHHVDPTSY